MAEFYNLLYPQSTKSLLLKQYLIWIAVDEMRNPELKLLKKKEVQNSNYEKQNKKFQWGVFI